MRPPFLRGWCGWGSQRIGRSDCLSKTQVRAKPQGDVYALTPARCWKVKRSPQPPQWGRRGEFKPQ